MSNSKSNAQKNADALRFSLMSSDRPLDALLPELTFQAPAIAKSTLHPRILELGPSEGDAWVLALWSDPGSAQAIHNEVKKLLEATLLAHLCQSPDAGEALDRVPSRILLLAFSTVASNLAAALRAFGFRLDEHAQFDGDRLETLRQEGLSSGWEIPEKPVSIWSVRISQPQEGEPVYELHQRLRERLRGDFWGNEPGAFSLSAAAQIQHALGLRIQPDKAGLDTFEQAVARASHDGVIRWIPPVLFQALCDFVGVVTAAQWKHNVEWSLCEPDEGTFCPPPIFRVTRSDNKKQDHLAIGQHLMRWCVMPILDGEEIPSVWEWLEDEFGVGPTRH